MQLTVEKEYKGNHWIPNLQINRAAKMNQREFLERIDCIRYLRAQWEFRFTCYPTSETEYEFNRNLWEYVNNDQNALNTRNKVFNVGMPMPIYLFLRHTPKDKIFNGIELGLAGKYALKPEKREIMQKQLYPPVFNNAILLLDRYFKPFAVNATQGLMENLELEHFKHEFHNAFAAHCGNSAIYHLITPFEADKKWINFKTDESGFDVLLPFGYMRDDDWKRIVLDGQKEDLHRSESDQSMFEWWKHLYTKFHSSLTEDIY